MLKTQKQIFRILSKLAAKKCISIVLDAHLPEKINGLWVLIDGQEVIALRKDLQDLDKRNFVFAHELGHSILHKGKIDNAAYQANGWNNAYQRELEAEANDFAEKLIARLTKVVAYNG